MLPAKQYQRDSQATMNGEPACRGCEKDLQRPGCLQHGLDQTEGGQAPDPPFVLRVQHAHGVMQVLMQMQVQHVQETSYVSAVLKRRVGAP
jgi:hypothetical protein